MVNLISADFPAPAHVHALTTVRSTVLSDLNLPSAPFFLDQQHGRHIVCADFMPDKMSAYPQADAVFTTCPNTPCAVRTADCLPVLLSDLKGTCIAAIHAGWRGLASGIIANSVQSLPVLPSHLLVWLGPAIGPRAFKVGEDVHSVFSAVPSAFTSLPCPAGQAKKYLCDIYHLARHYLQASGIILKNIYGGKHCTFYEKELFYSYRRSQGQESLRMISLIWFS